MECNKNASAVARFRDHKHFPKNSLFFTISFNQVNDVYVKIYEIAQLYWVPQNSRNNSMGQCQFMLGDNEKNNKKILYLLDLKIWGFKGYYSGHGILATTDI
jgi:hypothetical protein